MTTSNIGASQGLAVSTHKDQPRIDSRIVAQHLGVAHHSIMRLIYTHEAGFKELGKVRFENQPLDSGQSEKYALLTEDQSYLLLTYTRNTKRVSGMKVKLIKAFSEARKAAQQHQQEYLPSYHELHDAIGLTAAQSKNQRRIH